MKTLQDVKDEFEKHGFEFQEDDKTFPFKMELVSKQVALENDLSTDEIPCILFGKTPFNEGFCLYTGYCFVWLNDMTAKEASVFGKQIASFEPLN